MPHIICVGAVYMDTILSVPHFPHEDTKLRATNLTRRRGGNTANTLEVLSQLLPHPERGTRTTRLSLLTVLPDRTSPDTRAVVASLPRVSTELFQCRQGAQSAASSYIIQSEESGTRTIVSANPLVEMSVEEFKTAIGAVLTSASGQPIPSTQGNMREDGSLQGAPEEADVWIHFEGRIPEVLLPCVSWLREVYGWSGRVRVSVECEKPDRVLMKQVAAQADVVFYSRLWAEANTPAPPSPTPPQPPVSAESFLHTQLPLTAPNATLICTWGSAGATLLQKADSRITTRSSVDAWRPPADRRTQSPIDSVGAGDTFIAGMLYVLVEQGSWGVERGLAFANELAGRKVVRRGFGGLGEEMRMRGAGEV